MPSSRRRSSTELSRHAAAALAAVVTLIAASPLRADDDVAAYRAAVTAGNQRFHDADYAGARAAFEQAYALHPQPLLLFDIASSFRREGEDALALQHYQRFLEEAVPDDPRRELARRTIDQLEDRIAARDAAARRADRAGRAARRARQHRAAPPAAVAKLPSAPPPSSSGAALRWSGAAAGAASLGAFTMAVLAARAARAAEHDLENLAPTQAWDQAQVDLYARGEASTRRAWLWGAAGAALATTGIVLFAVGAHTGGERDTTLSVVPSGRGATLGVASRF
jgi:hypothetical protein